MNPLICASCPQRAFSTFVALYGIAHRSVELHTLVPTVADWSTCRTFFDSGFPSVRRPVKDLADVSLVVFLERLFLLRVRFMFLTRPIVTRVLRARFLGDGVTNKTLLTTISDARENYGFSTIKTRTLIKLGILLPKLYKSHPPVP